MAHDVRTSRFMINFALCTVHEAHGWETFPKCGANLSNYLCPRPRISGISLPLGLYPAHKLQEFQKFQNVSQGQAIKKLIFKNT
jgi:hypothetical protein